MPRLCMLPVPGLRVKSDWAAVRERLLDDFPQVTDVLATTMAATLLVVYDGEADLDAWIHGITQAILTRRVGAGAPARVDPPIGGLCARADSASRAGSERLMTLQLTTSCSSPGGTERFGRPESWTRMISSLKREGHST
jgi:hypothetical protein